MTRDQLIEAVEKLSGAHCEQLYYVDSDEIDNHIPHFYSFCREHAAMVARIEALCEGASHYIAAAWAGDDSAQRCDWYRCDKPLDGGGLTDYGVDEALALHEEKPLEAHVYPAELVLAARAMCADDPRWATWEAHARRMLFGYVWRVRTRLAERFGQRCRVLKRGAMNNALVQFEDGYEVVTSRNYLRKAAA